MERIAIAALSLTVAVCTLTHLLRGLVSRPGQRQAPRLEESLVQGQSMRLINIQQQHADAAAMHQWINTLLAKNI